MDSNGGGLLRIAGALQRAREAGVDRLDAQLLLSHLLQQPRAWLLAHDGDTLDAAQESSFDTLLQRRAAGEPLAYVLGEAEFCGLRLQVTPAVLVPRPETELLVEWALQCGAQPPGSQCVIDLGTGSGAIALALQQRQPRLQVSASDASDAALAVAGANAQRLGLAVELHHGDWWAPLAGRRFGLAVSNPPYIAGGDAHLAALAHEPLAALTPDGDRVGDGLGALRCIIDGAPPHLMPGAWLLLEHGHDQAAAVQQLLAARGFEQAQTRHDLAGLPRCTGAVWPRTG